MEFSNALKLIREVPDFPKAGILFQDITPVLADSSAFAAVIAEMGKYSMDVDILAGIEARGFILAAALAGSSGKSFIPFRKSGKLPHLTHQESYGLEYGDDKIEVHIDAFSEGERVIIIDDVLATGGTLLAAIALTQRCGAIVERILVLLEIDFLAGRKRINDLYPEIEIVSLVHS
jgi:adenine phosphoribosyltransferase